MVQRLGARGIHLPDGLVYCDGAASFVAAYESYEYPISVADLVDTIVVYVIDVWGKDSVRVRFSR